MTTRIEELQKEVEMLFKSNGQDDYTIEVLKAQKVQRCQRILELNKEAHDIQNPPAASPVSVVIPEEEVK